MGLNGKNNTLVLGTVLLGISIILYQHHLLNGYKDTQPDQANQIDLGHGVTKSGSKQGTNSDINNNVNNNGMSIGTVSDSISKSGTHTTSSTSVSTTSSAQNASGLTSTRVSHADPEKPVSRQDPACVNTDPNGFYGTTQHLDIKERFGSLEVPFGVAGFSASYKAPWSLTIPSRQYRANLVIAEDRDGKKSAYVNMNIKVDNGTYQLPISDTKLVYLKPTPEFRWNLRLNAGASLVVYPSPDYNISLGISPFSYGIYNRTPDWMFANLNVGFLPSSHNISVSINPFLYRASTVIPLTDSIYIGPEIGVSGLRDYYLSLGVRLAL